MKASEIFSENIHMQCQLDASFGAGVSFFKTDSRMNLVQEQFRVCPGLGKLSTVGF